MKISNDDLSRNKSKILNKGLLGFACLLGTTNLYAQNLASPTLAKADVTSTPTTVTIGPKGGAVGPRLVTMLYLKSNQATFGKPYPTIRLCEHISRAWIIDGVGPDRVWTQAPRPGRPPFAVHFWGSQVSGTATFTRLIPNREYVARFQIFPGQGSCRNGGEYKEYDGIWTAPGPPTGYDKPTVTANSVTFTNAGNAAGFTRHYFVAIAELEFGGTHVPTNPEEKQVQSGIVKDSDITNGSVTFGGNSIGVTLRENTKYYFYLIDRNVQLSLGSIPLVRTATTAPGAPKGYDRYTRTATSVTFTNGGFRPGNVTRRYYASTSDSFSPQSNGQSTDASGIAGAADDEGDHTSVTFSGLTTGTAYYFYFVDYNVAFMLISQALKRGPIEASNAPVNPSNAGEGGNGGTGGGENGGDGKFDPVWATKEVSQKRLYPNPATDSVQVPVSSGMAVVFDSNGAHMGAFVIAAGQIDLSDLLAGNYIMRLSDGSVFRVVKQ